MRLAIVSDIHGNLEALDAVLADLDRQTVDRTYCLGDFVGYGASPNECIERLRPRIAGAVAGNHDHAAIGRLELGDFNHSAAVAANWTRDALTPEHHAYLAGLPYEILLPDVRLVHASPAEPARWHYVLSPADAGYEMATYPERVCLIGHSHYPGAFEATGASRPKSPAPGMRAPAPAGVRYTREAELRFPPGARYLINVGSVGQPRDGDPRAAYLLLDDSEGWARHVRIPYDVESAARRILDAGLPPFLAQRLSWGE